MPLTHTQHGGSVQQTHTQTQKKKHRETHTNTHTQTHTHTHTNTNTQNMQETYDKEWIRIRDEFFSNTVFGNVDIDKCVL